MERRLVPRPRDENLFSQIFSLYESLRGLAPSEQVEFDLSELHWACPALLLPLTAYAQRTRSTFLTEGCQVAGYLDAIQFPSGVDSIARFPDPSKTYVPISVLRVNAGQEREKVESAFGNMIYKAVDSRVDGFKNGLLYPITELVSNIFDHGKTDTGYVFGQYYPSKEYVDICVVDCGRGVAQSYKDELGLDLSDQESIMEAVKGNSTKADKERGFGIWTSKGMVCEGLGGSFAYISGGMLLYSSLGKEVWVPLPEFYWRGVVVAMRIPKPSKPVDFSKYLE